jgi:tRNA threonylcarbamoyladenosine biosynthesis protein TsaB
MNSLFLLLDTTASVSTYALSKGTEIMAVKHHHAAQEQAAVINVLIDALFKENNVSISALSGIIICAGPGSYTGMRISYSVAKGMCYALDIPLIAINKLDVWSHNYKNGHVLTALQAREGEYFVSEIIDTKVYLQPQHILAEKLLSSLQKSKVDFIITDDISISQFLQLKEAKVYEIDKESALNVEALLALGLKKYEQHQFEDIAYSEPMYLKGVHTTISKKKLLDI